MLYFSEAGRHVGYEIFDIFVDMESLLLTSYSQHFMCSRRIALFLLGNAKTTLYDALSANIACLLFASCPACQGLSGMP
jgi:hypothetical protein